MCRPPELLSPGGLALETMGKPAGLAANNSASRIGMWVAVEEIQVPKKGVVRLVAEGGGGFLGSMLHVVARLSHLTYDFGLTDCDVCVF